jgi:hypothetical protein
MVVLLLRYYLNSTVFSAKHKGAQEIFCVDFKERVVYYREKAFYESISLSVKACGFASSPKGRAPCGSRSACTEPGRCIASPFGRGGFAKQRRRGLVLHLIKGTIL